MVRHAKSTRNFPDDGELATVTADATSPFNASVEPSMPTPLSPTITSNQLLLRLLSLQRVIHPAYTPTNLALLQRPGGVNIRGVRAEGDRAMVARHFGALTNALRWKNATIMKDFLTRHLSLDVSIPNLEFPYPLSYTCMNTSSIRHFGYISHVDDSKLLFVAEMANNKKICIKFVCHYSKDVHALCASKGFAKGFALTLKGFRELPGWMAYGSYGDD